MRNSAQPLLQETKSLFGSLYIVLKNIHKNLQLLVLKQFLVSARQSMFDMRQRMLFGMSANESGTLGGNPMKFFTAAAMALTLSVSAGAVSAACDDGEIVIKFSHVTNTDRHPKGIAATLLETRVNEEMNGKACMEVFPNSTLYNDDQVLEALLQGDVQLAAPSLSKFEQFTKQFRIFDLPFMFKNINAVDEFQNSETGQAMKASMTRRGLLGLAFWHNGMKQMSANKALMSPSDANGLKFRVQNSDVLKAQMAAMGGSPQPMAFSEVYGALQTGVVDGQENTWSNIYGRKFFEVQDGVTETNHGIIVNRPGFTGDCLVLLTRLYRLCSCFYRMPPRLRLA